MNTKPKPDFPIKDESAWLRLVFIVLFVVAFNIAGLVLLIAVLVQFISKAFTGKPLPSVAIFGQKLATFLYEVIRFLSFETGEMPWPFAPWPDGAPKQDRLGQQQRPAAEGAASE